MRYPWRTSKSAHDDSYRLEGYQVGRECEYQPDRCVGDQGYQRALDILISSLYSYQTSCAIEDTKRKEAQRLLDEAVLVIEYRKSYAAKTGWPLGKDHTNVLELWERLGLKREHRNM